MTNNTLRDNLLTRLFRRPIDTLKNVLTFHEKFRCTIGNVQFIPNGTAQDTLEALEEELMDYRVYLRVHAKNDLRAARMALIVEELAELTKALAERDLVKALDAFADLDYVEKGSVVAFGLHPVFWEACDRVHKSNLSKLDDNGEPIFDEVGKVKKSHNYRPVDLSDLIEKH